MEMSIGRTLRPLSFLVVGLSLSVIGGRAESVGDDGQGRMPPIPKKYLPLDNCPSCGPIPTTANANVTVACAPYWFDGEIYQATLTFKSSDDYNDFKNLNTTVYLCYHSNAPNQDYMWSLDHQRKIDLGNMSCLAVFRTCRPGGDQGTGSGRIIIVGSSAARTYYVNLPQGLQWYQ